MKRHRVLLLAAASFTALLHAADPAFEFSGVMTTGSQTRIALTDPATKATTWVEPGQEYRGYTVTRYDPKEDAVFLKRAGQETRLALVASKTPDAARAGNAVASPSAATLAAETTANAIRGNLRLLANAAREYQAQHGVSTVTYADLVGPNKLIKELKPIAGENYSTLSFGPDVIGVNVTTGTGMTVALDVPPAIVNLPVASSIAAQAADAAARGATPTGTAALNAAATSNPPTLPTTTPAAVTAATPLTVPETLTPTGRQPVSPSYTIQGGDTWEKISGATGVPVQDLKRMNPAILDGSVLPSGQTIRVR